MASLELEEFVLSKSVAEDEHENENENENDMAMLVSELGQGNQSIFSAEESSPTKHGSIPDEAEVEELLSAKLLNGYTLLEQPCPKCLIPLIIKKPVSPETLETLASPDHKRATTCSETSTTSKASSSDSDSSCCLEFSDEISKVQLVSSQSLVTMSEPIRGVGYCVTCHSYVVTCQAEKEILDKYKVVTATSTTSSQKADNMSLSSANNNFVTLIKNQLSNHHHDDSNSSLQGSAYSIGGVTEYSKHSNYQIQGKRLMRMVASQEDQGMEMKLDISPTDEEQEEDARDDAITTSTDISVHAPEVCDDEREDANQGDHMDEEAVVFDDQEPNLDILNHDSVETASYSEQGTEVNFQGEAILCNSLSSAGLKTANPPSESKHESTMSPDAEASLASPEMNEPVFSSKSHEPQGNEDFLKSDGMERTVRVVEENIDLHQTSTQSRLCESNSMEDPEASVFLTDEHQEMVMMKHHEKLNLCVSRTAETDTDDTMDDGIFSLDPVASNKSKTFPEEENNGYDNEAADDEPNDDDDRDEDGIEPALSQDSVTEISKALDKIENDTISMLESLKIAKSKDDETVSLSDNLSFWDDAVSIISAGKKSSKPSSCQSTTASSTSVSGATLATADIDDDVMKEYTARREIATKVLGTKMLQGYALRESQCEQCGMPQMEYKSIVHCVVCPVLARKAKKELKKRQRLQELGDSLERGDSSEEEKDMVDEILEKLEDSSVKFNTSFEMKNQQNMMENASETASCKEEHHLRVTQEKESALDDPTGAISTQGTGEQLSKIEPLATSMAQSILESLDQDNNEVANDLEFPASPAQEVMCESKEESLSFSSLCVAATPPSDLEAADARRMFLEAREKLLLEEAKVARSDVGILEAQLRDEELKLLSETKRLETMERMRLGNEIEFQSPQESMLAVLALQEERKRLRKEALRLKESRDFSSAKDETQSEVMNEMAEKAAETELIKALEREAQLKAREAEHAIAKAKIALNEVNTAKKDILEHVNTQQGEAMQDSVDTCEEKELILPSASFLSHERWEKLRAEGRSTMTRRLIAGWSMLPKYCVGAECQNSPLLSKGEKIECVVCGGDGSGQDGAYSQEKGWRSESDSESSKFNSSSSSFSNQAIATDDSVVQPKATGVLSVQQIHEDFEEKRRLVSKEIGKRMLQGWTLLDLSCPNCVMPLLTDEDGMNEICVLCGIVGKLSSDSVGGEHEEAEDCREINNKEINKADDQFETKLEMAPTTNIQHGNISTNVSTSTNEIIESDSNNKYLCEDTAVPIGVAVASASAQFVDVSKKTGAFVSTKTKEFMADCEVHGAAAGARLAEASQKTNKFVSEKAKELISETADASKTAADFMQSTYTDVSGKTKELVQINCGPDEMAKLQEASRLTADFVGEKLAKATETTGAFVNGRYKEESERLYKISVHTQAFLNEKADDFVHEKFGPEGLDKLHQLREGCTETQDQIKNAARQTQDFVEEHQPHVEEQCKTTGACVMENSKPAVQGVVAMLSSPCSPRSTSAQDGMQGGESEQVVQTKNLKPQGDVKQQAVLNHFERHSPKQSRKDDNERSKPEFMPVDPRVIAENASSDISLGDLSRLEVPAGQDSLKMKARGRSEVPSFRKLAMALSKASEENAWMETSKKYRPGPEIYSPDSFEALASKLSTSKYLENMEGIAEEDATTVDSMVPVASQSVVEDSKPSSPPKTKHVKKGAAAVALQMIKDKSAIRAVQNSAKNDSLKANSKARIQAMRLSVDTTSANMEQLQSEPQSPHPTSGFIKPQTSPEMKIQKPVLAESELTSAKAEPTPRLAELSSSPRKYLPNAATPASSSKPLASPIRPSLEAERASSPKVPSSPSNYYDLTARLRRMVAGSSPRSSSSVFRPSRSEPNSPMKSSADPPDHLVSPVSRLNLKHLHSPRQNRHEDPPAMTSYHFQRRIGKDPEDRTITFEKDETSHYAQSRDSRLASPSTRLSQSSPRASPLAMLASARARSFGGVSPSPRAFRTFSFPESPSSRIRRTAEDEDCVTLVIPKDFDVTNDEQLRDLILAAKDGHGHALANNQLALQGRITRSGNTEIINVVDLDLDDDGYLETPNSHVLKVQTGYDASQSLGFAHAPSPGEKAARQLGASDMPSPSPRIRTFDSPRRTNSSGSSSFKLGGFHESPRQVQSSDNETFALSSPPSGMGEPNRKWTERKNRPKITPESMANRTRPKQNKQRPARSNSGDGVRFSIFDDGKSKRESPKPDAMLGSQRNVSPYYNSQSKPSTNYVHFDTRQDNHSFDSKNDNGERIPKDPIGDIQRRDSQKLEYSRSWNSGYDQLFKMLSHSSDNTSGIRDAATPRSTTHDSLSYSYEQGKMNFGQTTPRGGFANDNRNDNRLFHDHARNASPRRMMSSDSQSFDSNYRAGKSDVYTSMSFASNASGRYSHHSSSIKSKDVIDGSASVSSGSTNGKKPPRSPRKPRRASYSGVSSPRSSVYGEESDHTTYGAWTHRSLSEEKPADSRTYGGLVVGIGSRDQREGSPLIGRSASSSDRSSSYYYSRAGQRGPSNEDDIVVLNSGSQGSGIEIMTHVDHRLPMLRSSTSSTLGNGSKAEPFEVLTHTGEAAVPGEYTQSKNGDRSRAYKRSGSADEMLHHTTHAAAKRSLSASRSSGNYKSSEENSESIERVDALVQSAKEAAKGIVTGGSSRNRASKMDALAMTRQSNVPTADGRNLSSEDIAELVGSSSEIKGVLSNDVLSANSVTFDGIIGKMNSFKSKLGPSPSLSKSASAASGGSGYSSGGSRSKEKNMINLIEKFTTAAAGVETRTSRVNTSGEGTKEAAENSRESRDDGRP